MLEKTPPESAPKAPSGAPAFELTPEPSSEPISDPISAPVTDPATAPLSPNLAVDLLPKLLQSWVHAIGLPATLKLVQEYGGFRLYIPARITPAHPLAKLLSLPTASALIKHHGPEAGVLVPKAQAALRAVRNAKMMSEYGVKTAAQLAREHGLSEPAIWRIVAKHEASRAAARAAQTAANQPQLW